MVSHSKSITHLKIMIFSFLDDIGILCSYWLDGSVCCDWPSLLWLVYSALIGLLCSDWSDGSVCCDLV